MNDPIFVNSMEFCCGLYKHEIFFSNALLTFFLRINKCLTQFYGKTTFLKIQIKVNSCKGTSSTLFIYAITVSTKNSKQNELGAKAKTKNNLQNYLPPTNNIIRNDLPFSRTIVSLSHEVN